MPKLTRAFECKFCHKLYHNLVSCVRHETICPKNPDSVCCKSCIYFSSKINPITKRPGIFCTRINEFITIQGSQTCRHFDQLRKQE